MIEDRYIEHLENDITSAEERVQRIEQTIAEGGFVEQRWIDDAAQDLTRLREELREAQSDIELAAFADLERRKQEL